MHTILCSSDASEFQQPASSAFDSKSATSTMWPRCRDLMAAKAGYREALVALGGLASLVALLDAPEKLVTLYVAQALGHIASTASCRGAVR